MKKNLPTVLIVDDEPQERLSLGHKIGKFGHTIYEAATGNDACEISMKNNIDVVFIDFKMHELNGIETGKKLRDINPDMIQVMVTAYGAIKDAVHSIKSGFTDYLEKPVQEDVINGVLIKLCRQYDKNLELRELRKQYENYQRSVDIKGQSESLKKVIKEANKAAEVDSKVLLLGETGTGKEIIAKYIHNTSKRKKKPFIALNCAELPKDLLESELFGHEKGSFTGAHKTKKGRLELADGGTVFLDEITEMPISLQAKLLRVFSEEEIHPVGGIETQPIKINVRFITSCNQDLEELVRVNNFRKDLYYRINVIPISLPPLRERKEDIPILANHFIKYFSKKIQKKALKIRDSVMEEMLSYRWPGNIRELEHRIERAVVFSDDSKIVENFKSILREYEKERGRDSKANSLKLIWPNDLTKIDLNKVREYIEFCFMYINENRSLPQFIKNMEIFIKTKKGEKGNSRSRTFGQHLHDNSMDWVRIIRDNNNYLKPIIPILTKCKSIETALLREGINIDDTA